MKRSDKKKLNAYAAFSAAFLCMTHRADAQIVYRDVDPDVNVYLDDYFIDMDGDGNSDFKFIYTIDSGIGDAPPQIRVRINPLGSNRAASTLQSIPVTYSGAPWYTYGGGATQFSFTVAPVLNEGDIVNSGWNFQSNIVNLYEKLYFSVYSSYNFVAFKPGDWQGKEDKFAAVQLNISGTLHYGWVRLSLNETDHLVVKDFAYSTIENDPVTTQVVQYSTSWIMVQDAGITGTGADIQFSFNAAVDESGIQQYKVVCIKQSEADDFTTDMILSPDQYVLINPDGSASYTANFLATSRDTDGDLIAPGQKYKLRIINMMQPATHFEDMLSFSSMAVELIDTVQSIQSLELTDQADFGNASDLKVKFNAPASDQGISEYRVMIVKKDSADAFVLSDAQAVDATRYIAVSAGDPDYTIFPPADFPDTDGDLIEPGKYKAFVLSVADGSTAVIDSLSSASSVATLETATTVTPAILLEDVGEFGDGRDIKITVTHAPIEQTIDEYRIYLVNFIDAFDFDISAALAVSADNYISRIPDENDFVINGTEGYSDINGDPVTWGVPYYIYIASIASQYGINDTLSAPSNQVILNFPMVENISVPVTIQADIFSSGDQVHVQINQLGTPLQFSIFNSLGEMLFTEQVKDLQNSYGLSLPEGLYIASLTSDTFSTSVQLLIGK